MPQLQNGYKESITTARKNPTNIDIKPVATNWMRFAKNIYSFNKT